MPPAKSHDQCRTEMCGACGGRAGTRKVTPAFQSLLKKWAQPSWSPDVTSFPCGVCNMCRFLIYECEKNNSKELEGRPGATERWTNFKLESISVPRGILAADCTCPICKARRTNSVGQAGFGNKNMEKPKIGTELFTRESLLKEKSSMCLECFQSKTGKGIPHSCTQAKRKENLAKLVIDEKGRGNEQIIAKVIKNIKKNTDGELRSVFHHF